MLLRLLRLRPRQRHLVGGVDGCCQNLVANGQNLIRAAVPQQLLLLLGVDLLLQVLLAAQAPCRLPVGLRASAKVAVVDVLKVLGHGVLVVAVNTAFLLWPMRVVPILEGEKGSGGGEETESGVSGHIGFQTWDQQSQCHA